MIIITKKFIISLKDNILSNNINKLDNKYYKFKKEFLLSIWRRYKKDVLQSGCSDLTSRCPGI